MNSLTEYVNKLQSLTTQNLEILKAINESFYTKAEHITTNISDTMYTIPSFLYLENKVNELDLNFQNLVNAPLTGQASFTFDGSTQGIQLQGYEVAPEKVSINPLDLETFKLESNDIFKDFITPLIYLKLTLDELPEHLSTILVKKVVIKNKELLELLKSTTTNTSNDNKRALTGNVSYKDYIAKVFNYTKDVDYVEYNTTYKTQIKKYDYDGSYSINKIIETYTNTESFIEYYELTTNEPLTYMFNNGTVTGKLKVGDILLTYDNRCQLEIMDININSNYLKLRVNNGYTNIIESDKTNSNLSKLKLYRPKDKFKDTKYIKVPLEEDENIMLFISPVNDNIYLQAQWSEGTLINTYNLKLFNNSINNDDPDSLYFQQYYNDNIKNIGDILYDIAMFSDSTLSNLSVESYNNLTSFKPSIDPKKLSVVLMNKHLTDNTKLDNIRSLNKQKAETNNNLLVVQNEIDSINSILSVTDFSNMTIQARRDYENRLTELNKQKNNLTLNLISDINNITSSATNTVIPAKSSKYSIIGYIDTNTIEEYLMNNLQEAALKVNIIKLNIQYRYKNVNKVTSNLTSIDDSFTYSDWVVTKPIYRNKESYYDYSTKSIKYRFTNPNDTTVDQFNAFSIAITQGESVDIKVQLQYSLGYPYVGVYSGWSDVYNVEFPDDLVVTQDVADIVDQNNKDAKSIEIDQSLVNNGVISHIDDKIIDQESTFFHRPESISSGFYTDDSRRVISLKDKLYTITNELEYLKSMLMMNSINNLSFILNDKKQSLVVRPNNSNQIFTIESYNDLTSSNGGFKYCILTVQLSNSGSTPITLYSMFPGDNVYQIGSNASRWDENYYSQDESIIKLNNKVAINRQSGNKDEIPQLQDQFLYFRTKRFDNTVIPYSTKDLNVDDNNNKMTICPYISSITDIQLNNTNRSYYTINPGEIVTFNIYVQVFFKEGSQSTDNNISTFSLDLWYSQFNDPINFTFDIESKYINNNIYNESEAWKNLYTPVVQRPTSN